MTDRRDGTAGTGGTGRHPAQNGDSPAPREGAAIVSIVPAATGTGVQPCASCGRSSKEKRPLRAQERAALHAVKRAWRTAIDATHTKLVEIADRVDRSDAYIGRCISEAHDDAPRAEWLPLLPDALFVALTSELRHTKPRLPGAAAQNPIALAHDGVFAATAALRRADEAMRDGHLDASERSGLAADGAEFMRIGEELQALAKGGAR